MANDWFSGFSRLVKGTKARADAVNSLFDQVETGLDKLPSENELNRGTRNYTANTGAANAYAASFSHISTSYATGQEVELLIDSADINTAAACTLDISGIGGISIKYPGGSNPAIGDLVGTCKFKYSGTVWHFMSTAVNQPSYAEEWATKAEDSLVSTAAGGDGSTDYSSLHHAAKASASSSSASSSASSASSSASAASISASTAAASADMVEQFKATEAATPDMTVLIKAGKLMYGGTLASQIQQSATITASDATLNRIDRVVIDEQTGGVSVITGVLDASPVAPAILAGTLPVCQVQVNAATAAITNLMITDERASQSYTDPVYPAFRAEYSGTSYSYTSGGLITTDTESFDKTGDFDNSTTYRFTPSEAGIYFVNAHVTTLEGSVGVNLDLYINKNSSIIASYTTTSTGNGQKMSLNVSDMIEMNGTTDYVDITIAASTTIYGTGTYSGRGTFFEAFRVQGL